MERETVLNLTLGNLSTPTVWAELRLIFSIMLKEKVTITVWFPTGSTVIYHETTLKDVVLDQINKSSEASPESTPLLLEINSGLRLYYDKQKLFAYASGELEFDEVLEYLGCEALYRNTSLLKDERDNEVDPGCLWKLRDGTLYLVDVDNHLTCHFDSVQQLFTKIA